LDALRLRAQCSCRKSEQHFSPNTTRCLEVLGATCVRSAALIFGLLAGLFGCGAIVFGNLESGLSAIAALGTHHELIAKFGLYLIPNIGLLGAGLALAKPRL